jgi:hypothetical protein
VAEAAELGAEDRIGAGGGGGEVEMDGLAGDGVLLEAHLGDGEAMDDVLSVEAKVYFAACGQNEFGGDKVVGGVGVRRIRTVEAEGVAFAGSYEVGMGAAEGGVGAGVAEVPGELYASDFDLESGGVGSCVVGGGPEAFGLDGQGCEEQGEDGQGKVFDAPEVGRFRAATNDEADDEDQVGESEESQGDPEVEKEMMIERGAVSAGVGRQRAGEVEEGKQSAHRDRINRAVRQASSTWIFGSGSVWVTNCSCRQPVFAGCRQVWIVRSARYVLLDTGVDPSMIDLLVLRRLV